MSQKILTQSVGKPTPSTKRFPCLDTETGFELVEVECKHSRSALLAPPFRGAVCKKEEDDDRKSDDDKSSCDEKVILVTAEREATLPRGLTAMKGSKGLQYENAITYGAQVACNSGAGKYLCTIAGVTAFGWLNFSAAQEFSVLDQLFDEVFLRSVDFMYFPRNKYRGVPPGQPDNVGAANPENLQSCAATLWHYPHAGPAQADAASAWVQGAVAQQHHSFMTGDRFTKRFLNVEKFGWRNPLGDMSTAGSTQGWVQTGAYGSKMGGIMQFALAAPTAAAASVTAFNESIILGDVIMKVNFAWRARS